MAMESSERLTRLINDILDIERMRFGELPMGPVPVATDELLRAAVAETSGLAAAAGVRLSVGPGSGRVVADADRIVQTLTNLVGNAVKFSSEGGVVRLEATPGDGEMVFAVHDRGRGIPEDKLEVVFEPFEQVDSTDARQKGGTGLGLAISRGIVERHGGRIWAESAPGRGTTVRFTLPLVGQAGERTGEGVSEGTALALGEEDPAAVPG
jgi:signal transduction histidine kinase